MGAYVHELKRTITGASYFASAHAYLRCWGAHCPSGMLIVDCQMQSGVSGQHTWDPGADIYAWEKS